MTPQAVKNRPPGGTVYGTVLIGEGQITGGDDVFFDDVHFFVNRRSTFFQHVTFL